jgi:hypothetical protein
MQQLNLPPCPLRLTERDGRQLVFDPLRRRWVALTPEEWVRQHFVGYLIASRGCPAGRVANEVSLAVGKTRKRSDTVVYDALGEPLAIVEYKAPTVEVTQAVFDQIVRYNSTLRARYLIVSNGMAHYCCRIDYERGTYGFLRDIPTYHEMLDD